MMIQKIERFTGVGKRKTVGRHLAGMYPAGYKQVHPLAGLMGTGGLAVISA